ncbi:hypothetical protein CU035_2368 [Enterococcus faecium]|nr:hypothetical protein [Enterococcus faecium]MBK4794168.1 hypothetical protein [Enterococcus faecium]MBK4804885.1 hypothetical protein [Enterococcus faecium]MBK4818227.1 hypothetical protein [Enterococcus faecium]
MNDIYKSLDIEVYSVFSTYLVRLLNEDFLSKISIIPTY